VPLLEGQSEHSHRGTIFCSPGRACESVAQAKEGLAQLEGTLQIADRLGERCSAAARPVSRCPVIFAVRCESPLPDRHDHSRRNHEWLFRVGLTRSTHDRRTAGLGALPPFTGTKAKDPLPPSCGVPVGRHEGQLWVNCAGSCPRQARPIDGHQRTCSMLIDASGRRHAQTIQAHYT
jgi:hypothetical protein